MFEGGWIPTLDMSLKVITDNKITYKFFEKETCSNTSVQKDSAMEENAKIKVISDDLIGRLTNTMESTGKVERDREND